MTLARTRLLVAVFGGAVLAAVVAGLLAVGGPNAGRRDRRDSARLDAIHRIADALACHADAAAEPARPATLADLTPSCLAPDAVAGLTDPRSGRAYPDRLSGARPGDGLRRLRGPAPRPPLRRPGAVRRGERLRQRQPWRASG